ncbi:MAG: hypothetical protein ABEL51_00855 [Salinibacter sp.]
MRPLFTVALLAELPFGLGLALTPTLLVNLLGMPVSTAGTPLLRAFGTALLGFSVLLWIGRQSDSAETHWAVLASLETYLIPSSLVFLVGQLSGFMNAMGWGVVGLQVGLAVAFGYALAAT